MENFGVTTPDYYYYLNQTGTFTVEDMDDKKDFSDTMVCTRLCTCLRVGLQLTCCTCLSGGHVCRGAVGGRAGIGSAAGGSDPSCGEHQLQGGEQLRSGGESGL